MLQCLNALSCPPFVALSTRRQFQIYFSAIHRVLQVNHPDFEHTHVVGDLTYIQPTSSFQGFQPNSRIVIPIVREYWSVQETDNMPRWFVVDDRDGSTAVIANTDTEDLRGFVAPYTSTMKTPTDANVHMTASSRFSRKRCNALPCPFHCVNHRSGQEFQATD